MNTIRTAVIALSLFGLLAGCSGGGGGSGAVTKPPRASVVTSAQAAAPLASCPAGGITVDAGIDDNGNGSLDAGEIDVTQFVCNGSNGSNGVTSLVLVTDEAAGGNCAGGGKRIQSGPDTNASGVLDPAEVGNSNFICNGTSGANGISSLLAIGSEAAGANCPHGGSKIAAGQDANGNSVLEAAEVTSTTYACNGAPGTGVSWSEVTGATQQAVSGAGYFANNAAQVTITLPAAPALGDVVAVSGTGAGGWKIAQNAGQSIVSRVLPNTYGALWTARESNRFWRSVASSADGNKLIAADMGLGIDGGQLYTSTDAGMTWTARESPRAWIAVASSADGNKLVAAVMSGEIHTSTDAGITWTARDSARRWSALASSADGSKLVAAEYDGRLYTSTDSGVTWTARESVRRWVSVASSADGSKLVAADAGVGAGDGQLYTSTDSGVSWTPREPPRRWGVVASSADGNKLAATSDGQLFTSSDAGFSWTARVAGTWGALASSADGRKLLAVSGGFSGAQIFTSNDSGQTWTANSAAAPWALVASSADGSKLVAAAQGGQLYTSETRTTAGTAGALLGAQWETVELQYAGDGTWMISDYAGELAIQ